MFRWLKRKPSKTSDSVLSGDDPEFRAKLTKAIQDFGTLIEKNPLSVMDVSMLPLPKKEMMAAFMFAWKFAVDQQARDLMETAFISLADFQDGVGPEPISRAIPDDIDPKKPDPEAILKHLDRISKWDEVVEAERETLMALLQNLKAQFADSE